MNPTLGMTHGILGHNTWLFQASVKDIQDDQADYRINDATNSFLRIAGHVAVGRFGMMQFLQLEGPQHSWGAFGEFGLGKQFGDDLEAPALSEITSQFGAVSQALLGALPDVSDDLLAGASPIPIPGDNPTVRDLLTFTVMHETYHIGQLGLIRKSMTSDRIMG